MHPEFLDEDIMTLFEDEVDDEDKDKWIVWFDDASNALGHGVEAVLLTPNDQCIPFMARLGFDYTKIWPSMRCAPLESKQQSTSRSSCSKCMETQLGNSLAERRMED